MNNNTFYLAWIEFSLFTFNSIIENDITKIIIKVEKILQEYFLINSYIFTNYQSNKNISDFSNKYNSNLIFSRHKNFFNLQIWCVKKTDLYKIEKNDYWINIQNQYIKMFFINSLKSEMKTNFIDQTNDIYVKLFSIIDKYWYLNQDIIKARNYIQDILIHYKNFNIIRDNFFKERLILSNYSAWTWIDCILPSNIKHLSNYFLLHSFTKDITISTISSDLQCEANNYWPKFSRWKLITSFIDKNKILFISWTAAVGKNWKSLFIDDIDKNIEYTFKSIENLLSKISMDWNDIISAFIYIKKESFYDNFIKIYKKNNFNFPYIYTFCDICRDDFLFEIECIAVKKNLN